MDRLCPLLALGTDGRTVVDGVDSGHRCHAEPEPVPLDRQVQAQRCLVPAHERCERYLQHVARRGSVPGRSVLADGLVSTRLVLSPEPAWRGIAGRARRGRSGRLAAVGAAIVAAGAGGAALAGPVIDGGVSILDAGTSAPPETSALTAAPDDTATPTAAPAPSPPATPTTSATPEPSPPASAAPLGATATPTPVAVPATPPSSQTYIVQEGDTLAEIAQQFGTTIEALQAANDIGDPNEIVVGDVITIP